MDEDKDDEMVAAQPSAAAAVDGDERDNDDDDRDAGRDDDADGNDDDDNEDDDDAPATVTVAANAGEPAAPTTAAPSAPPTQTADTGGGDDDDDDEDDDDAPASEAGSAGAPNQAAAPSAGSSQNVDVRQDVGIEQYIEVAQQNAARNTADSREADQLRAELAALRASIEQNISDARQSFADQLAEAQRALAAREAAQQQTVEVVQKVVVVQQQVEQPTAPAQIININVDNTVVNNTIVQNNVTVIQGGAQQTRVEGTDESDIVFAAANNALLTGGAGDDILAAGPTKIYLADLAPLNGSAARGTAILVQDEDTLTVRVEARGLEPDRVHIQDINGRFAGDEFADAGVAASAAAAGEPTPIDSVVPPRGADTDGDGFVEYAELLPYTGPGIMGLASPQGDYANGFPTADEDGRITFMQAYDLRGEIDPVGFTKDDLLPLELRAIVLYGQTVGAAGAGTPGEVNGTAGYKLVLPVAAGEIELIPATARVESNVTINATLDGGDGDDILLGKDGNDILRGGTGDDWLAGSGGQNRLDGGDGADTFVLGRGEHLVEDFDFAEGDRLLIAGDQADVNAVIASAVVTGTGARLTTEDGGQITLVGVAAGDVNAAWFETV